MNKYFLYVGNAYPHKNLERLIDATLLLNKDGDEKVLLKIASSKNVFTKRLRNFIKQKNAGAVVKLLGFVSDSELPNLYKNSVAFVFPTLSEGFGLPGIEAMDAGTIVLASNIPVLREVYEDCAYYFDPKDARSITLAMEWALNLSASKKNDMVVKSRKFVKRYSWKKMALQTLKLYEAV